MKKLVMLGSGSVKGPLSIRLLALARHLGSHWHVTVILPSADKYNKFRPNPKASVSNATLLQPWQLATTSPMLNLIPYLFTALVALLRARADMVYLYKPTPITIMGLVPRLLTHTPVVLDMDDLGSEVMKREGQSRFAYGLVAMCERLAMRWADAVIVASTSLESIVRQKYPTKHVLVLPNGVEPGDYRPVAKSAPRKNIYYFGVVNSLDLIEDLLQAAPEILKQVPTTHITIAGGGRALDEAKALATKLGIADAVTFTGWINMLDAQNYTQFADVAICYQPDTLTVRAASNMKVFQYMAMRTVSVVSDVGDLHQYVQDGRAGAVVAPGDAKALSTTIVDLLQDDARRIALANAGYDLARHEYSWQERAEKLHTFMTTQVRKRP